MCHNAGERMALRSGQPRQPGRRERLCMGADDRQTNFADNCQCLRARARGVMSIHFVPVCVSGEEGTLWEVWGVSASGGVEAGGWVSESSGFDSGSHWPLQPCDPRHYTPRRQDLAWLS